MRGFQQLFPLCASRPANWLNALNPKWLNDGSNWHVVPQSFDSIVRMQSDAHWVRISQETSLFVQ